MQNRVVPIVAVRPAVADDGEAIASIYAPYVEQTAISFEEVAPSREEMSTRIEACRVRWQWLVADVDGVVVGFAYGSQHRARSAYRWSVEVSAYVDRQYHRVGVGRALYEVLLSDLVDKGFCNAYAGITMPNEASVKLHTTMGFQPVGTFRSVGWKFGQWHDVAWFQRQLRDRPPAE